jgi:squalene synthase HpnC
VVSFLVKKDLRKHVAAIYWFARTADDYADEGSFSNEVRLENLKDFRTGLDGLLEGKYNSGYEAALHNTIASMNLSPRYFYDLISAFEQDVIKNRFNNFDEILDYCRRSADPVGRLILELHGINHPDALGFSDKVCTGLQLANFYQDVSLDIAKGRIYFPGDEMKKFGVVEEMLLEKNFNDEVKQLMRFSAERAAGFLSGGRNLLNFLTGRLKYEINWTILGGEAILEKIKALDFNVLQKRPKLNKKDFLILLLRSFK